MARRSLLSCLALAACTANPATAPVDPCPSAPPASEPACDPAAWTAPHADVALTRADGDGRCGLRVEAARTARIERALDLKTYAGKRIRVHGWGKVDAVSDLRWALLRLFSEAPSRLESVGTDLLDGGHITWRPVDLCLDVPGDSQQLTLSLALPAGTAAVLGGLSIAVVGDAVARDPDLRPVDRPDNLVAFARTFGALRWFYPARADADQWHALAIAGVAAAERARDPAELAHVLEAWAEAIGPEIHVSPGSPDPSAPTEFTPLTPGWHHFGVAGESSHYHSDFVGADGDLDPGRVTVDLGGGLVLRFPRAFRDQAVARRLARPPVRDACALRADPRGERLATIVTAWSLIQQFHPHLDLLPIDWPAALPPALQAAALADTQDDLVHVLRRMLAPLDDARAWVDHEARPHCPLPLAWRWIGDDLVVTGVAPGESAVRVGDIVESIDGVPALTAVRAAEPEVASANPATRRWKAAAKLFLEPGRPVTDLELRDPSGARERVAVACDDGRDLPISANPPIRELPGGIVVVEPWQLDDDGLAAAMPRLAEARGVVFDLRAHVGLSLRFLGHLTDAPLSLESPQKIETVLPERRATRTHGARPFRLPALTPRLRGPVAFVADERTAGNSERILALVAFHRLAAIVGDTTTGIHGNPNGAWIPDGTFLRWTASRTVRPDGSVVVAAGVEPTLRVRPQAQDLADGRDRVLEAAADLLRQSAAAP